MNFGDKLANFFSFGKIIDRVRLGYTKIRTVIIDSYNRAKIGDENMKIILIYWSVLPAVLYFFIRHKAILGGLIAFILDICFFLLFCLAYYFIAKAIEKHPELDISKMKELEKIKYYETLTEEQLKEEKKKETRKKVSDTIKRFVFLSNQDAIEPFKVVRTLLLLFILISLKRIMF